MESNTDNPATPISLLRNGNQSIEKTFIHTPMSTAALFTRTKGTEATVSINKWAHTYNRLKPAFKGGNQAICDQMDGPRGYCVTWNRQSTGKQALTDLFMCNWKLSSEVEQTDESPRPGCWREDKGEEVPSTRYWISARRNAFSLVAQNKNWNDRAGYIWKLIKMDRKYF